MASKKIDISNNCIRDVNGFIIGFDYNAIFNKMKTTLLLHYIPQNYSKKCNSFMILYGRTNKKPFYGDFGSIKGLCYILESNEPLSFFVGLNNTRSSADDGTKTGVSGVYILSSANSTKKPIATIKKIEVDFRATTSTTYYTVTEDTYSEQELKVAYLADTNSTVYYYYLSNFDPPTSDLWRSDYISIKNGSKYLGNNCKENFNAVNLAWHEYAEESFKKLYGRNIDYQWRTALPLSEQALKDNTIEFDDWYLSPMPIISMLNSDNEKTKEVVKHIVDDNGDWSDVTIKYPINTKTNWKIYIDGTKLPNYKILWENKDIEKSKDTDNARIQIQYAEVDPEYPIELRVPELIHETNFAEYNDGNYKTNFKTLYEGAWGEVYDESIMSNLPKQSVWLLLQLDYYGNGITTVLPTQSSTKMAVLLNPSGKDLYSYADIWNTDGSTDGSTIKVITDKGSGEGDDGYKDDTDKGEEDITDGASNSVGVLTTTYAMTIERLNQLGGFLWGANIFDEFSLVNSNPIENIISCKNIPISLSGTDEIIHLGNVDTGTNGAKVSSNFSTLNVGQIALPTKYNSFLDFAPYTKITIYLPYIGFKEIDATIAIGKTLKVAYVADVITGGCIAQIFINGVRFYEFSGEMGVDIPITASNRAQVEASYISNAVGMGASLASGNITGAVDSVLASATAKYNYSSTDTPNANCVASVNRTCYVIIERPTYQELSKFNHTKGKMCNLSKTIGNLKGFTICDSNIDLSGIIATEQEKQEISSILSSGFFA